MSKVAPLVFFSVTLLCSFIDVVECQPMNTSIVCLHPCLPADISHVLSCTDGAKIATLSASFVYNYINQPTDKCCEFANHSCFVQYPENDLTKVHKQCLGQQHCIWNPSTQSNTTGLSICPKPAGLENGNWWLDASQIFYTCESGEKLCSFKLTVVV